MFGKMEFEEKVSLIKMLIDEIALVLNESIRKLELSDKVYDEHMVDKYEDMEVLELEGQEAFIMHCIKTKQVLISVMYAIKYPQVMHKIQQLTTIEAMKNEVSEGNVPKEVVDDLLDYMNDIKSY